MFENIDWNSEAVGKHCYDLVRFLFPICRSITGPGVRETLGHIRSCLPELAIHEVASGTPAFDWSVPDEWIIRDAFIADRMGRRVVDFQENNLHVMGYSEPVDAWLPLESLDAHLYSLPELPHAIPYATSYYSRRWGFCLTHEAREKLAQGEYHVIIDSEIKPGVMNYGECVLPGKTDQEVLLSTYICHPSMANNELSGPAVTTALACWLRAMQGSHRYTYRIVYIPETIGSIYYLSRHLAHLKAKVVAGFNITCCGDERCYSYLPSRSGDTLADRAAKHALKHIDPEYRKYSWLDRGSDERQYCAPGIDLPVASIMRSKYGCYPEYHTSLDDLTLVTPKGLGGAFLALQTAIEAIENDGYPVAAIYCEPQLGKRGLYPTLSTRNSADAVKGMMDVLSYCDGSHSMMEIAEIVDLPVMRVVELLAPLLSHGVINMNDTRPA